MELKSGIYDCTQTKFWQKFSYFICLLENKFIVICIINNFVNSFCIDNIQNHFMATFTIKDFFSLKKYLTERQEVDFFEHGFRF